jgi:branched-subunit amino acid ABC-type transport system permease component
MTQPTTGPDREPAGESARQPAAARREGARLRLGDPAVAGGIATAAVVLLSVALGGDFVGSALRGLSFGSVYALLAVGLVLAYRTTGVFNLAFGPQAFLAAAVYYDTHVTHGWPMFVALAFTLLVVAPLVGVILDRFLFRYLRTAGETAKLVSVLGLYVAIPQMLFLWFGQLAKSNAEGIVPDGSVRYELTDDVTLFRDDIAVILCGLAIIGGLTFLFRYTALGLRMRAVVESPRLTELAGVNAERVGMASWALSSMVAGLAGVLLAPIFAGQVDYVYYQRLVVAAIAAAVIGQLSSIPLAFVGGLLLGVTQQVLDKYLPTNSFFASTLRPALPFVVGFVVLVLSPALARRRPVTDPLAGVDPPPPALASADRPPLLTLLTRVSAVVFFTVVGYWLFFSADDVWIDRFARIAILAIIFLSVTVITGLAGQVSLCQASFAAIGAAATAQLSVQQGMSVLLAFFVGAAIAGAAGALVALPVLRLGGVFLAIATLAFAYFFDAIILQLGWVGGGTAIFQTPRPQLGSIDFGGGHDAAFLVLTLVILTVVGIAVIWVRNGTTGRYLDAMRGSEVAAAAIGINRNRARIVAFGLSAAIAGLGGGLMASYTRGGNAASIQGIFAPEFGLVWIVLVVTLGARTIEGAIQAAIGFVFFAEVVLPTWIPWVVNHVQPFYHMESLPVGLQPILFGLGALTYAKHPEGVLEFNKRKSYERIARLVQRFRGRPEQMAEGPGSPPSAEVAATVSTGSGR